MIIPPMSASRHLCGFRTTARVKAFLERVRGKEVLIKHELVKSDGTLLQWLYKSTRPLSLLPFYAAWPDAKVAWAVYSWEVFE